MLTNACKALAKHWVSRHHSHVWCSIHIRQGFYLDLWPFLNPLVIKIVLKSVHYAPFLQWSV